MIVPVLFSLICAVVMPLKQRYFVSSSGVVLEKALNFMDIPFLAGWREKIWLGYPAYIM